MRGKVSADYHKDAARPTLRLLDEAGLRYSVLGGGRIVHSAEPPTLHIYGYSMGFPWEGDYKHDISAATCSQHFKGYTITTSDEGY